MKSNSHCIFKEVLVVPLQANTKSEATSFAASVCLRHGDYRYYCIIYFVRCMELCVFLLKKGLQITVSLTKMKLILHRHTCQVKTSIDLLQRCVLAIAACKAWPLSHLLFSTYPRLGTYRSFVKEHPPSKECPPPAFWPNLLKLVPTLEQASCG